MRESIDTICREVTQVAINVGVYLKEEQKKLSQSSIEMKSARNYVTYIDKTAEQLAVAGLKTILPEAGFLTEEETVEHTQKEYTWIVDPLDGTTNYVHGDTPYTVSIALMHKNKIILGVVYDPVANELYSATTDTKATLNGEPIAISNKKTLENGYIGFGIPYKLDTKGEEILLRTTLQFRKCSFRIKGSAAIEICYVATGRSDAYFHSGLSPWDVAAAAFILEQAGGKITDFSGGNNYIFGREIIASNGFIHHEIMEQIIDNQNNG